MSGPLEVRVIGTPAPQGSKRAVARGVLVESSTKVRPWRDAVAYAVHQRMRATGHIGWQIGPVTVAITFWLHRPVSLPKTKVCWPWHRPDLDKLLRSTFDALSESGVWRDDAQVVTCHARKRYVAEGQATGAGITIFGGAATSELDVAVARHPAGRKP